MADPFADLIPGADVATAAGLFDDLIPAEEDEASLLGTIGQGAVETAKGVPEGAIGVAGSALQGAAGAQKAAQHNAADFGRQQLEIMDRIDRGEDVPEMDDAMGYRHMDPEQRQAARARLERAQASFDPGTVEESALYRAGSDVQKFGRELTPAAPGWEDSMARKVGAGLGSVAGGVATSIATGPVGAGAVFTLAGSGEAVDRAVKNGATEDEIIQAAKAGQIPGMTDSLPVETLLGRIPLPGGQFIKIPANALGAVLKAGRRVGFQALVEGIQEGGQEYLQNLIQQQYDEEQGATEGVGESATVGGVVGGVMGALIPGRDRGAPAATARPEEQAESKAGMFDDLVPEGALPAEQVLGREEAETGATPTVQAEADGSITLPEIVVTPEGDPDPERLNSPRLTPEDRASPIPNDLIDDGKAILEDALKPLPPVQERVSAPVEAAPVPVPEAGSVATREIMEGARSIGQKTGQPAEEGEAPAPEAAPALQEIGGQEPATEMEREQERADFIRSRRTELGGEELTRATERVRKAETARQQHERAVFEAEQQQRDVRYIERHPSFEPEFKAQVDEEIRSKRRAQSMATRGVTAARKDLETIRGPLDERAAREWEAREPTRTADPEPQGAEAEPTPPRGIIGQKGTSAADADKRLRSVDYDLSRLADGEVESVMRRASVLEAARAVQRQDIRSRETDIAEMAAARPVINGAGPGLRRVETAPADAKVYERGMGTAVTRRDHIRELGQKRAEVARLKERDAAGEVEPKYQMLVEVGRSRSEGESRERSRPASSQALEPQDVPATRQPIADTPRTETPATTALARLSQSVERQAAPAETDRAREALRTALDVPLTAQDTAESEAAGVPRRQMFGELTNLIERDVPAARQADDQAEVSRLERRAEQIFTRLQAGSTATAEAAPTGTDIPRFAGRRSEQSVDAAEIEELTAEARQWRTARSSLDPRSETYREDFDRITQRLNPIAERLEKLTGDPRGLDAAEVSARYTDTTEFAPEQELIKAAAKEFGITPNAGAAGYILPDGRMLNFSEKGGDGSRTEDHRAVERLPGIQGSRVDAMVDFMNRTGAVRVDFASGLFETQRVPTLQQMRKAVRAAREAGGGLIVEATRPDGSPKSSVALDRPSVEELKRFFEEQAGGKAFFKIKIGGERGQAGDRPEGSMPPADTGAFRIRTGAAGFDVESVLTEPFVEKAEALSKRLRKDLDTLGLKDIGLRVSESISMFVNGERGEADGVYFKNLIDIALDADDPASTLNHEAVHALRNLRLFSDSEWAILSRKSKSEWMDRYNIRDTYAGFPEWAQIEEGVAHAYASWAAGKKTDGILARTFKRIRAFLESLGSALRGEGFTSPDAVFSRVSRGEVGDRPRDQFGRFAKAEMPAPELREPVTAEDRQQHMQGMLAKGQPIDRVIRMPFDWFGGLTEDGQWKPGKRAADAAAKAITQAKFSPEGRLAWLNPTLETARAGLIDRYGLDPDYVERERVRKLDERRIMFEGAEILKTLKDQDVGVEEARVLQAVLTGKDVADADMKKLAVPIREAIDRLGQEAVTLGLLSEESYERNRGAYLHRVYTKHEADQNALVKFTNRIMNASRKKIVGDQFKGRGIFFDVDAARLEQDMGDTPEKGDKIRILDRVGGETQKVTKRVYVPAGKGIPDQYEGYTDRGVWEVRGTKKGKVVLWRDYTEAERTSMGEILDARYTIGKTFMLMAHDLATGRFYKDIAANPEWATATEPEGSWKNGDEVRRGATDSSLQWVKVPDTDIPKSGGKKRWGALSGKWVRAEIWRDLNEIEIMQQPTTWRSLLTQWKLNKTARHPVVHMNNVMSNLVFMDLADIRSQDLFAGIRSFAKGDKHYKEAVENGAFGSDMMSQEIRNNVLQPILDDLTKDMQDGKVNSFIGRAKFLGKIADRLYTGVKTADRKMIDAYRAEDEIFRMATYIRRRQFGDTPQQAADFARQQFLDYDIRAPWVNAARNTVLPFISYTYRAVPLVAKAVMTRPWKLAKYYIIAEALNALAYGIDDEADEERERASLRDHEQGYAWIGVPRMLRMPFRNEDGLPVFLDIRRWIPAGDVFDTNQGSSALPIPAPLQFGGPLMIGAELALNKQGFTGEEITNRKTDSLWEQAGDSADYLWKAWMPSAAWVPGSWYWEKIGNAMSGATDRQGRPYDVGTAVASSFGVKLKPQDVDEGLYWQGFEIRKIEQELKSQARRLARQRDRNLVSEREFNQGMHRIMEKVGRLQERAQKLQDAASKD